MGVGDLSTLRGFVPIAKVGVTVDDGFDQLNRVFMFSLMAIMSVVVTMRGFLGNIIVCYGFNTFPGDFASDYCWTQGLYTIREAYDHPDANVPYPGIIPEEIPACMAGRLTIYGDVIKCPDKDLIVPPERVYHLWYQWVPFYFVLGAIAFYLPYVVFKNLGMFEVKQVVANLYHCVGSDDDIDATENKVASWLAMTFRAYIRPGNCFGVLTQRHKVAVAILITKITYLIISLAFFILTRRMFKIGNWLSYGVDWAITSGNETDHIRDKIFPKMVACEIKRWGPTGIEEEQGMCVLAPNVVNQYLFLIMWFALVFVIAMNVISLLMTPFSICLPSFSYSKFRTAALLPNNPSVRRLYYNVGVSGRVILNIMALNTKPKIMEDLMNKLVNKLRDHKLLDEDFEESGL